MLISRNSCCITITKKINRKATKAQSWTYFSPRKKKWKTLFCRVKQILFFFLYRTLILFTSTIPASCDIFSSDCIVFRSLFFYERNLFAFVSFLRICSNKNKQISRYLERLPFSIPFNVLFIIITYPPISGLKCIENWVIPMEFKNKWKLNHITVADECSSGFLPRAFLQYISNKYMIRNIYLFNIIIKCSILWRGIWNCI